MGKEFVSHHWPVTELRDLIILDLLALYCLTGGVSFSPSSSVVYLPVFGYVVHVVAAVIFPWLLGGCQRY